MNEIYLNLEFRKHRVYQESSPEHREIMLEIFSQMNINEKSVHFGGKNIVLNSGEFVLDVGKIISNPYYNFTRGQVRSTLNKLVRWGFLLKIVSGSSGSIYRITEAFSKYYGYKNNENI